MYTDYLFYAILVCNHTFGSPTSIPNHNLISTFHLHSSPLFPV